MCSSAMPKRRCVHLGIWRLKSTWRRLWRGLRLAYLRSMVRIALHEVGSLPGHIYRCRKTNPPGIAPDSLLLPSEPRAYHPVSPIIGACIAGIQKAHNQFGSGRLGLRLYARGFDEGARWMWNSCREDTHKCTTTECLQSNRQKTSVAVYQSESRGMDPHPVDNAHDDPERHKNNAQDGQHPPYRRETANGGL